MSAHQLQLALDFIQLNSKLAEFAGPQPEGRVANAERALGFNLPPIYREFVLQLGCGSIAGEEFYGVNTDDFENSSVPDAIWTTLKNRKDGSIREQFIVVASTGDGGYYVIDTAEQNSDGESPVLEWWPGFSETEGNGRVVAADFAEFLLDKIRPAIESFQHSSNDK